MLALAAVGAVVGMIAVAIEQRRMERQRQERRRILAHLRRFTTEVDRDRAA
jgi:hypothetical protein